MRKILLSLFIATLLALSTQGCFLGVEPGSYEYTGDTGQEPPPILFEVPPDVIVMPDTRDVYVVPDIYIDLYFWNGWWWRSWEGRWYRSFYYDRGWIYYRSIPGFYFDVNPGWRIYYKNRNWQGHRWHYEKISNQRLQQNWKSWQNNRYWEREKTWGVENYQPQIERQRQKIRLQQQQDTPKQQNRQEQNRQNRPQTQRQIQQQQDTPKQQNRQEQKKIFLTIPRNTEI
ncbi:MAG: hypothetical protein A4E74_00042 [Syntrophus sp. PtaB.Bin075]|nr:MAG: hypothetical protein A4E74_00042 [Syntrophus sp. PtaB.Bin075]